MHFNLRAQNPDLAVYICSPECQSARVVILNSLSSRRSTDRLSAIAPENYFTMGLKSALNDSQNRRTALLDKLREAQDTLRVRQL